MKYKYLFFLSFFVFNSYSMFYSANTLYAENENEQPQYWETIIPNPKGLVLVAHGLNVKPSKMGSPSAEGTLVKLLLDSGYNVYRITLKGHNGPIEDMQSVTRLDWINNAYFQYCQAKTIANNGNLPLYLLGFSLGALVYEVLMNEETAIPVRFKKVILFSPAIAIRSRAKTVHWLKPFTNDRSIIGSVSPKEYRAQVGTSIAAYRIVFDMEKSLRSAFFNNSNVDTIIFTDKNDEMISIGILRKRMNKYNLTNWRICEVTNSGAIIRPSYHHLLIDNKCVSAVTWQYISETILGFLD